MSLALRTTSAKQANRESAPTPHTANRYGAFKKNEILWV